MKQSIAAYIRNLQRASDHTKKVWLIGVSGVAMALVIALWVLYLNFTLRAANEESLEKMMSEEETETQSAYDTFKNGFGNIKQEFNRVFRNAKERINEGLDVIRRQAQKTNDYSFPGAANGDMIPQNTPSQIIDPVPPAMLP